MESKIISRWRNQPSSISPIGEYVVTAMLNRIKGLRRPNRMGPHPAARRHKLVVKSFEPRRPGAYKAKAAIATSSSSPTPPAPTSSPAAASKPEPARAPKPPVISPPSPGVDRKPVDLAKQLRKKRIRLDALKWLK